MKRLILMFLFVSASSFAESNTPLQNNTHNLYQDRCAKERDPVKRHNYCYMLENSERSHAQTSVFKSDTAVV